MDDLAKMKYKLANRKNIAKEKKQQFPDLMWQGKNVGQASEIVGIDSSVGAQVIIRNAGSMFPIKVSE